MFCAVVCMAARDLPGAVPDLIHGGSGKRICITPARQMISGGVLKCRNGLLIRER